MQLIITMVTVGRPDQVNPLQMMHQLLYLKTQSIPHSKHFSSRL